MQQFSLWRNWKNLKNEKKFILTDLNHLGTTHVSTLWFATHTLGTPALDGACCIGMCPFNGTSQRSREQSNRTRQHRAILRQASDPVDQGLLDRQEALSGHSAVRNWGRLNIDRTRSGGFWKPGDRRGARTPRWNGEGRGGWTFAEACGSDEKLNWISIAKRGALQQWWSQL